jgi:hypothetical protein
MEPEFYLPKRKWQPFVRLLASAGIIEREILTVKAGKLGGY